MELIRSVPLFRGFLRALTLDPDGCRETWLTLFLQSIREATEASAAVLGESAEKGWVEQALVGGRLERREMRRLLGLTRRLVDQGGSLLEPVIRRGSRFDPRCDGWAGIAAQGMAAIVVPRTPPGRAWLTLLREEGNPRFTPETLMVLELAATAAATALQNEEQREALEKLALTDGLTHIPNYRYILQAINAEIARSLRFEEFFTVVMVDVDNLKLYNQSYGHLGGSEILRELAGILRQAIRRTDAVAKYGGDEFLILLPRTRPSGGVLLCERIRRRIGEELRGRGGEALSCSFGVAGFPEDGCDFESLVRSADQALFQAKQVGRDAVVCLASCVRPEERRVA